MKLAAICCTYHRPAMLQNVLACFESQTHEDRRLLIVDDAGQYADGQSGDNGRWLMRSVAERYPTLAGKHAAAVQMARMLWPEIDAVAVMDDDDIYLPDHLSMLAAAMGDAAWGQQWRVFSTYQRPVGEVAMEDSRGRFHGSWAFRCDAYDAAGGYPFTRDRAFDQQFGQRLMTQHGPPGLACGGRQPTYVYRWGRGAYHTSATGSDAHFYEELERYGYRTFYGLVRPSFDPETIAIAKFLGVTLPAGSGADHSPSASASAEHSATI